MARRRLAGSQRGALVRLDVRAQAPAGQRFGHGADIGLEPAGVHEERRCRELGGLHSRHATDRHGGRGDEPPGTLRAVGTPWLGDACGLVDAFRAGELSPPEALEESIAAMEASPLNAFSFTDFERAADAARRADISLPFGGVPFGVKELEKVEGWPYTEASVVFRDRVADHDDTSLSRLRATGAVLAAQTTAPEFGGINCTSTELHGTTRNPWNLERTPGGSSGGTAAAVAGGLLPIATGSDGGGSIRGPAGFSGLFGLKATYGRIPKGPDGTIEPMTTVLGCLTRSVRDTARYFDACNGFDPRDPLSLPRVEGWEAGLGTHDLSGMTAAIVVDLGIAEVREEVAALVAVSAGAAWPGPPASDSSPWRRPCRRCGAPGPWRTSHRSWPIWAMPIPTASASCHGRWRPGSRAPGSATTSSGPPPSSATGGSSTAPWPTSSTRPTSCSARPIPTSPSRRRGRRRPPFPGAT